MNAKRKTILPIAIAIVSILVIAVAPALAKDSKKKAPPSHKSAAAAAASMGHVPQVSEAPKRGHVKDIQDNAYTVEDYEGNQVKLYVGQGTKHIKNKKVGDTVRAEITRGGFANSIQ